LIDRPSAVALGRQTGFGGKFLGGFLAGLLAAFMGTYAPVTDDELSRARSDPAFRQKMLSQNMEALLEGIKKLRKTPAVNGEGKKQIREGVELAVRLAEMIQGPARTIARL
jgi:hypothetical protein